MKNRSISISLPEEVIISLVAEAKESKRSLSSIVLEKLTSKEPK
jgi:hypothetical protein